MDAAAKVTSYITDWKFVLAVAGIAAAVIALDGKIVRSPSNQAKAADARWNGLAAVL